MLRSTSAPLFTWCLACAASIASADPARTQELTHGTMVGDITSESAIVWARADRACELAVAFGPSPDADRFTVTDPVAVDEAGGFMARLPLRGLRSATEYHYCIELRAGGARTRSRPARFRTAPAADRATRATFTFAADALHAPRFDQWSRMLAHEPDLHLSLGDMPYADGARSRSDFRQAHLALRAHEPMQAFFGCVGLACTWDDHEVVNDWDAASERALVRDGVAAWHDCLPVRDGEIWRRVRWGGAIEFFVLDCRSQRDASSAPDLPGRTMLGEAQRRWLVEAIATSDAAFKVLVSSVPLRGGTSGKDSWLGFQRERDALLAALRARAVRQLVVLCADQHWFAVNHHGDGIREYQVGPLAAPLREPPAFPEPFAAFVHRGTGFGVLTVDPTAAPPELTVALHGERGELWQETIRGEAPAELTVDGAVAGVRVAGPQRFVDAGRQVAAPSLAAGALALHFAAGAAGKPVSLPLRVPPGANVRAAVDLGATAAVLSHDFAAMPDLFIEDDGPRDGPSAWFVADGVLWQSSAIGGPRLELQGTRATCASLQDGDVAVRVRSHGSGALGVLLRRQPDGRCVRCTLDPEALRLHEVRGRTTVEIAAAAPGLEQGRWYELHIRLRGHDVTVAVDGTEVLRADTDLLDRGAVALFTSSNVLSSFDDLEIGSAATVGTRPLFRTGFEHAGTKGLTDELGVQNAAFWRPMGRVLHAGAAPLAADRDATSLLVAAPLPASCRVRALVRPRAASGSFGVCARFSAADQHYRFVLDPAAGEVRLERRMGSDLQVLGRAPAPPQDGCWHELALQVDGFRLAASVDDATVVQVLDGGHSRGGAGLYASARADAEFADLAVTAPAKALPSVAVVSEPGSGARYVAYAPGAPGASFALEAVLDRPGPALPGLDGVEIFVLQRPAAAHAVWLWPFGEVGPRGEIEVAAVDGAAAGLLRGQAVLLRAVLVSAEGDSVLGRLPAVALTGS